MELYYRMNANKRELDTDVRASSSSESKLKYFWCVLGFKAYEELCCPKGNTSVEIIACDEFICNTFGYIGVLTQFQFSLITWANSKILNLFVLLSRYQ